MRGETQPTPISQALTLFWLDAKGRRLSPKTITLYQHQLPRFADYCEQNGVTTVDGITASWVRAYLVHLQDRGLAAWTVHGFARAIRTFCNFLVNEELLAKSPMAKVAMPELDKRILPAFQTDDVKRLLSACRNKRDRAAVLFLADTGLRASEFLNLNGGDVDLAMGTVQILSSNYHLVMGQHMIILIVEAGPRQNAYRNLDTLRRRIQEHLNKPT